MNFAQWQWKNLITFFTCTIAAILLIVSCSQAETRDKEAKKAAESAAYATKVRERDAAHERDLAEARARSALASEKSRAESAELAAKLKDEAKHGYNDRNYNLPNPNFNAPNFYCGRWCRPWRW